MTFSDTEPAAGAESLAWSLAHCTPSFSDALIGDRSSSALAAACAQLPLDLSTFWGVETPLGDPAPGVDFLVEIKRGSPGHQVLASAPGPLIEAMRRSSEAWQALLGFARRWADDDDPLHDAVRNIWLEFDLIAASRSGDPMDALDHPCVFWGPEAQAAGTLTTGGLLALVARSFTPFPRRVPHDALEAATRMLPAGARVFQVGAMHARGDVVLRVCVNRIAPADIPPWLGALGWPGDLQALTATLDALGPMTRTLAVDVDFTEAGVGATLGVECYQDWNVLERSQWTRLLDRVADLRLLDPSKREALAAFPARTDFPLSAQLPLKRHGFLYPVLFRNVHHIKLAFRDASVIEAKGYLGVARPGVNFEAFSQTGTTGGSGDEWLAL
jgi:hypothetical protein